MNHINRFIIIILCFFHFNLAHSETENEAWHRHDNYRRHQSTQTQQPSAIDNWFGDMMGQAFAQSILNVQKLRQEKGAEFATLRPPYEAKHSRAKQLLSGYTLIFENNTPIWFDPNGNAASQGQSGTPYSFKWFVQADKVCMGRSRVKAKCMNFVFDEKRKTTGIKKNSGEVIYTFQLIGADIKNLSKNNK